MQNSTRSKSRTLSNPQEKNNKMIEHEERIEDLIRSSEQETLNMKKYSNRINEPNQQIEPNQIMILISRLRQERNELRCAVRFLNIEQSSLLSTHQTLIDELCKELKEKEVKSELQRNSLVLALALVRKNQYNKKRKQEMDGFGLKRLDGFGWFGNEQDHMQIEPSHEPVRRTELQKSISEKPTSNDTFLSQTQVQKVNQPISDSHSQTPTYENLLETRTIELQSVQEDLTVSQSKVTAYESTIKSLEEELRELRSQVVQHQRDHSELEDELVSLKSKVQEPKNSDSNLNLNLNNSDHHQAQELTKSLVEELNQTKISLDETLGMVSGLKEAQVVNESVLEEIEKHCATLCVQLQEKTDELTRLEGELKTKETKFEEVCTEHEVIRSDLVNQLEKKSKQIEGLQTEKKVRSEALKDGIEELKNGIEEFKTEEQNLTNRFGLHEDMKNELEERSERLTRDLVLASHQLEDLKSEKEEKCEGFEVMVSELKVRIQVLESENQRLVQQLDSHEEHNQQLEMIRHELSNQLALSTAKSIDEETEQEERSNQMKGRIRELSVMVDELRNEKEKLIHLPELIDRINEQHERIRDEMKERIEIQSDRLKEVEDEKEEKEKKFEVENERQKKRIEGLEDELNGFQRRLGGDLIHLEELGKSRDELESLRVLMTKVQNEKEESCSAFEAEIQLQKTRIEELESELKSTQETLDLKESALQDLDQARAELEVLRESMTNLQNEKEESCSALQAEIQVQKTRVGEVEAELQSTRETLDAEEGASEDLDQARAELEVLRQSMMNLKNEKEESCSALQAEIRVQKARVEELEGELKSTQETSNLNRTASEDLDQARAELEVLRESMTNLQNEKEESCSALQAEIEAQKTRIEEVEAELESTREALDSKQTGLDELDQARAELEVLRESMTNVENEKEERCSALQAEIEAQKTRIEELEGELKSTRETLDAKESALEDLDQARAELEVLRESMTNVESEKEESCSALQAEIQVQKTRVEELEAELKSTRETSNLNQTASEDSDQARAELEVLRESMTNVESEKEEKCSALQAEIEAQKTRVEELEVELKSTRETLDAKESALEDLDQARAELEVLRESMTSVDEKEERCAALQAEIEAQKTRVEELEGELKFTRETLDAKESALQDLDQARVELELLRKSSDSQSKRYNEAESELERLRLEIVDLKVQQGLNDELAKEFDVLVAEFELHHNKLQQSMDEALALRNQVEEYSRTKHALLSDLEEKNTLINSLKADLATMSKLHRNTPSSVELTEKINDLETRLTSKTDEAEDAMDRLIDQMQKNKQLSSMVENLKVKIKAKEKSANQNVKEEPKQEPKQPMTFPSELESEPIPAALSAPSPASRKRKLGYVANPINSNKLNSTLNPVIDAKENPTSNSDGSLPRKTILHPKLANQEVNQEIQRTESQPLQLKSVNVTQTKTEEEGNRRRLRERTSSSINSKPGSTTSAHLLASIQSLRKKQQQANVANLPNSGHSGQSGSDGNLMMSNCKPKRTNS